MKTAIQVLIFSLFTLQLAAQPAEYFPKEEDWFNYDLSYLMFLEGPEGFENGTWSNGHTLSLMNDILLGRSNFSIGVGFAYTSNNFYSNMRMKVSEVTGNAQYTIISDSANARNKYNAKYFEIPVELRFRTRPNRRGNFFRFYVGARGGVCFTGYSLYQTDKFQERYYKAKEYNRWSLGTYTRIGFGNVSLYGYYSLLDLFVYDARQNLPTGELDANGMRPVSLGVSFSF